MFEPFHNFYVLGIGLFFKSFCHLLIFLHLMPLKVFALFLNVVFFEPVQGFSLKFLVVEHFFFLFCYIWPFIQELNFILHQILSDLILVQELVLKPLLLFLFQFLLDLSLYFI